MDAGPLLSPAPQEDGMSRWKPRWRRGLFRGAMKDLIVGDEFKLPGPPARRGVSRGLLRESSLAILPH